MGLNLVGVLPVSGLQIGIAAGIPALQAKITKLQADLTKLALSASAQIEVGLNIPPNVAAVASGLLELAANLPTMLDPASMVTAGADANADIAVELGLIEAQIALVGEISATFQAGLDTGGLSAWSYAGNAAGFGERLESSTRNGYPGVGPDDHIQAIIIGCEDFSAWGNFSATFNTGTSSLRTVQSSTQADLDFLGTLTGGQLNTGVLELSLPIELYLLELEALKVNLELALSVTLGLNLPPLPDLIAALDVDAGLMVENMVNVSVELDLQIQLITLEIEFLLGLIADLQLALSAGGFALWTYSGPASGLGAEFKPEVAGGLPGGSGPSVPAYGVVVAASLPSAMASFGLIFLTG